MLAALAAIFPLLAAAQDLFLGSGRADQWTKVLLTEAAKEGAVCLDGSPGGFYLRRGTSNKWLIFHQGGGWCTSTSDCYARSRTGLGSSRDWPASYTDEYQGSKLFDTPPFDTFNVVYVMYCDGGSWTGDASETYENTTIYYRGRRLLDATLDDLLARGLSTSDELLYAGCSAGGLAVYSHIDYVRAKVPESVPMKGLAEAMFMLEHGNLNGELSSLTRTMQWGYTAWNSSLSVNQDCAQANQDGQGWRCLVGAVAAPFARTPLFVLNSKYDSWQKDVYNLRCFGSDFTGCDDESKAFWIDYGHDMVKMLDDLPNRHGAFFANCETHCSSGTENEWGGTIIDGVIMKDAFVQWYASSEPTKRLVDRCDGLSCQNNSCR